MIEQEHVDLLVEDFGDCEIPAPRAGKSYDLWLADTEGRHGCLDALVD